MVRGKSDFEQAIGAFVIKIPWILLTNDPKFHQQTYKQTIGKHFIWRCGTFHVPHLKIFQKIIWFVQFFLTLKSFYIIKYLDTKDMDQKEKDILLELP